MHHSFGHSYIYISKHMVRGNHHKETNDEKKRSEKKPCLK